MATRLSDHQIAAFLRERKTLPRDYRSKFNLKRKRGHEEQEFDVTGADGSRFRIVLRKSNINPLDFSVILGYLSEETSQMFRLRRYNGKSHEHTNPIERQSFYSCHIHEATERYQDLGMREDTFGVATDRYADIDGAISCMLTDCGFERTEDRQTALFEEIW